MVQDAAIWQEGFPFKTDSVPTLSIFEYGVLPYEQQVPMHTQTSLMSLIHIQ